MTSDARRPPHDANFEKYAQLGALHWREIGHHWIYHNAFTAERYRRVIAAAGPLGSARVLDYGCGDGALLSWLIPRVGPAGAAFGFEPNDLGRSLAAQMLGARGLQAQLAGSIDEIASGSVDVVTCGEVIEHVFDPEGLLAAIHRVLRPGGRAVLTTPVRMTETPDDPNHIREWFPGEFRALLEASPLRVVSCEPIIPAAAPEVFFWRPPFFFRVPVFRVLCNVLSIYGQVNALTWLRMRPRLLMTQIAVLKKD
jgi:SAM-dependent methyltransferase